MGNPVAVALQGKGFRPMLQRGGTLLERYGLTSAKMENELLCLVDTVHAYGCQATLPVTALPLSRHPELAQKLQAQGIELAVHGLKHVDHTQLPLEKLVSSLQQAAHIFSKAGIRAAGFRSPYLRWNVDTLAALQSCGFEYESSQALGFDVTEGLGTHGYERVLEFYGALRVSQHTALPYLQDNLVRIPYCLPDDEALVERLCLQNSQAMAEIWLAMLDFAYTHGELFTLGLHPERAPLCEEALRAVLKKARTLMPRVWIAKLDEIARWQRSLAQISFHARPIDGDGWQIVVQADSDAVLLARGVNIAGQAHTWTGNYSVFSSREITVHGCRRPWIGLAPECPSGLRDFLKQQGYLAETGSEAQEYSFYLRQPHFSLEDERPLLVEIEAGDWPLVRIARWPGGAKAALSITGDVDAFTLWDYGRRILNG